MFHAEHLYRLGQQTGCYLTLASISTEAKNSGDNGMSLAEIIGKSTVSCLAVLAISSTEKRLLAALLASSCLVLPRFFVQLPEIALTTTPHLFRNRHNGLLEILSDFAT